MRGDEKSNTARTEWKTVTVGGRHVMRRHQLAELDIDHSLVLYGQRRLPPEPNVQMLATKG